MRVALLRALFSLGVLSVLFLLLPWGEVREAVTRLRPLVWFGVLAGFLAGHRLGVAKWRLLVNAGRSGLAAAEALRCYAAGLFSNLYLPTMVGGDVLRAALAGRATGRMEAAVLGGLADRASDVLALALLMTGGALAVRGALPTGGARAVSLLLALGVAGGVGLAAVALSRPLRAWPRGLRRPVGRGLVAARRLRRHPATALAALGLSLVIQTGFVLLNAWIGRSVGIAAPLAAWFVVWPLAKVAGLLPVSLGGLGVRDATLGALLVPLGVPMARGVVASLAWQSVLVAGGLVAGGIWYALGRRRGRAEGLWGEARRAAARPGGARDRVRGARDRGGGGPGGGGGG